MVEVVEPRLLLSVSINATAAGVLQTELTHLQEVMGAIQTYGQLANALPLVSATAGSTVNSLGTLADFQTAFKNDILTPLQATIQQDLANGATALTSAFASDLQTAINSATGLNNATVTDHSSGAIIDFTFDVAATKSESFSLTLGSGGDAGAISFPNSLQGNLAFSYDFGFETKVDLTTPASPVFSLVDPVLTVGVEATATLPQGLDFDFGVVQLKVGNGASMDYSASVAIAINDTSAAAIDADATSANNGSTSFLNSAITVTVTDSNHDASNPLLTIPVELDASNTIPGLPSIASATITVTGHALGTALGSDWSVAMPSLSSLDPFSHITASDLFGLVSRLGDNLSALTSSGLLNVDIPLTNGTTIADVVNFATEFNTDVIQKLGPVSTILGFSNPTSTTAADGTHVATVDITPISLTDAPLPAEFKLYVTANGTSAELDLVNQVNGTPITTVAQLEGEIATALLGTSLANVVTVATVNNGAAIEFDAVATNKSQSPASITLSTPATSFTNLTDFALNLGQALGLGSTISDIQSILSSLGIAYDSAADTITWHLSYDASLPVFTNLTLGTGVSLGEIASLSGSGTLSLTANVAFDATLGINLDTLGTDVAIDGVSMTSTSFASSALINDLQTWGATVSTIGSDQITSDQQLGTTGNADMTVTLRDGTVGTIEFNAGAADGTGQSFIVTVGNDAPITVQGTGGAAGEHRAVLGDFLTALDDIEPGKVNAIYNNSTFSLELHDTSTPVATSPTSLGFTSGETVASNQIATGQPNAGEYQAILTAAPTAAIDSTQAMDFFVVVGSLNPVEVHIAAAAGRDGAGFAAAVNAAMATDVINPIELGLPSTHSTIHLSDLVTAGTTQVNIGTSASPNNVTALQLTTTMYNVPEIRAAADLSVLRADAKSSLEILAIDTSVTAANGSYLLNVLGIGGTDSNQRSQPEGVVYGTVLYSETLDDRFFVQDASIVASIDLILSNLTLSGSLGFLNFSGTGSGEVVFSADLSLQVPDGQSLITFAQISNAISSGNAGSLWDFTVSSGDPNAPWAQLTITDVTINGADVAGIASALNGGTAPSIEIEFTNPLTKLTDLTGATPQVVVTGLPTSLDGLKNMSFTDILAGVTAVLNELNDQSNGSLLATNIPIADISLGDALNLTNKFATIISNLQSDPASSVAQLSAALQQAIGTTDVSLAYDNASSTLSIVLNFTQTTTNAYSFNMSLATLAAEAGVTLPALVTDLAAADGSGTLQVTAGATIALALGIRMGGAPAVAGNLVSALNEGAGVKTNGTSAADLLFRTGGGLQFAVDLDALGTTATAADLIAAINTAATAAGFSGTLATLTAGQIVLTDNSTTASAAPGSVTALGFQSGQAGTIAGGNDVVTADISALGSGDFAKAYSFEMVVNGQSTLISVGSDAARTTASGLADAINDVLASTSISSTTVGGTSGTELLSTFVTAATSGSSLTLSATTTGLGVTAPTFAVASLPATALDLTALGFTATDAATDASGVLSVSTTLPASPNYAAEYTFDLTVDGAAKPVTIDIAADSHRTTATDLANAIRSALGTTIVSRSSLGLAGTGNVILGQLFEVGTAGSGNATTLTLSAADSKLATANSSAASFSISKHVAAAAPLTLSVTDIGTSGSAESLGFATTDQSVSTASGTARVLTGSEIDVSTSGDRVFINTAQTGITATLGISGTGLNFDASLGPLSVSIVNGTVTLGSETAVSGGHLDAATNAAFAVSTTTPATIAFGLKDGVELGLTDLSATAGRLYLAELTGQSASTLFSVTSNVAVSVDLPLEVLGVPLGSDLTVKIGNVLGTADSIVNNTIDTGSLPRSISFAVPDLTTALSAFSFLNNPLAVINGIDGLLGTVDTLFTQQIFGYKLPIVGTALADAGDFIGTLRADVVDYLRAAVKDYAAIHNGEQPTTADLIAGSLTTLLNQLGFAGGVTSATDVANQNITFDLDITKTVFNGIVNLSSDFGIPGLGLSISNGAVDLSLNLHLQLDFGYSTAKGFYFDDTLANEHAVALAFAITIPQNFSLSATLGILQATGLNATSTTFTRADGTTSTGTMLAGSVDLDLHSSTYNSLSDLGVTSITTAPTDDGTHLTYSTTLPDNFDSAAAYQFEIVIDGKEVLINVAAATGRDTADFVTALNAAIHAATIDWSVTDPSKTGTHALSDIVTVNLTGSTLNFVATKANLGAVGTFALEDVTLSGSQVASNLRAIIDADVDVDLMLTAQISVGGSFSLPSVSTELIFQYQIAKVLEGTYADAETGVVIPVTFKDITLDAGAFFSSFLLPILNAAWDVIGPIEPVLDFLTDPLPGVSSIVGHSVSLIDIAQLLGGDNPTIASVITTVKVIDEVANLIQEIKQISTGGTLKIDFGTYTFGTATVGPQAPAPSQGGPAATTFDPFSSSLSSVDVSSAVAKAGNTIQTIGSNAAASSAMSSVAALNNGSSTTAGKFSIPILTDPLSALQLLTGNASAVNLFVWQLPSFSFTFAKSWHFPLIGVPFVNIGADLGISFTASLNVTIGYDTLGITEFLSSHNPLFLEDGFYILDTQPQVTLDASISIGASLDLTLLRAGVTGTLHGEITMMLYDSTGTGKVRLDQILSEIEHDPLEIFVFTGEIDLTISAFVWIGIDIPIVGEITLVDLHFNIIGPITLVSFSTAPSPTPTLATQASDGTLTLNSGSLATNRLVGDNTATGGTFSVVGDQTGSGVTVYYTEDDGSVTSQHFDSASKINLDLANGNSNITMSNVSAPIVITGGDGNNTINLSGVSDPTITLGNGDNVITGSSSTTDPDIITVGNGNNIIHLSAGNDVVVAGNGNNIIDGTSGNKKITVGTGNNVIVGGSGSDTITAGTASSTGSNTIIAGLAISYIGSTLTADPNAVDGNNTINVLGSGQSIVFGGTGNNAITISGGDAVVMGATGTVTTAPTETASVSGTSVTIDGTPAAGDTVMVDIANAKLSATQDAIYAVQSGDTTATIAQGIASLINANQALATAGVTATVSGSEVTVTGSTTLTSHLFGNADDLVQASDTTAHGGNNTITYEGFGNFTAIGGGGNNTITGGTGINIILGDTGSIAGPSGAVNGQYAITSSDDGSGTDTIYGGPNADILAGGGGTSTITEYSGDSIILGHFGTVELSNSLTALSVSNTPLTLASLLISAQTIDDSSTVAGNSTITAGGGNDIILGGSGNNTITAGGGNDVLIGSFGKVVPANGTTPDVTSQDMDLATNGNNTINVGIGHNVVIGGGGADTINAGAGIDVIFGDGGEVTRNATTGAVLKADTIQQAYGGADTINVGMNTTATDTTQDVVFGGAGNNTINVYNGQNAVMAGFGSFTAVDGINPDVVGRDGNAVGTGNNTITVYNGTNVVMGGGGTNTLTSLNGDNLLMGANGSVIRDPTTLAPLYAISVEPSIGGNDTITTGLGSNYEIGGAGSNTINGGAGDDYAIGNDGTFTWTTAGIATNMASTNFAYGGADQISTGNGNNYVIGGSGDNVIRGGNGRDILIGPQGQITWNTDGTRNSATTVDQTPAINQNETIYGGDGNEDIIGGQGANKIYGGNGTDILIGGDGHVLFQNDLEYKAETLNQFDDGPNQITAGTGYNFIFGGGVVGNQINANPLKNLIFPTDGTIVLSPGRHAQFSTPPFMGNAITSPTGNWFFRNDVSDDSGTALHQFSNNGIPTTPFSVVRVDAGTESQSANVETTSPSSSDDALGAALNIDRGPALGASSLSDVIAAASFDTTMVMAASPADTSTQPHDAVVAIHDPAPNHGQSVDASPGSSAATNVFYFDALNGVLVREQHVAQGPRLVHAGGERPKLLMVG